MNDRDRDRSQAERERHAAGACIFREGEFALSAYIVETGCVEVVKDSADGPIHLSTLGPGELFGEMALIGDTNRTATVNALEDTVLLVVNPMALNDKLEAADPVVRRLIKVLIRRLRAQSNALADERTARAAEAQSAV